MSVYWFAVCPTHKEYCDAGSGHASGNFHFDEALGKFICKHAGCSIRFAPDPDSDSDPEFFDCNKIEVNREPE